MISLPLTAALYLTASVITDADAGTDLAGTHTPNPAPRSDQAPDPVPHPALELTPVQVVDERVIIAPGKGITVRSPDGRYQATMRARVHLRDTFTHDKLDTNELNVARLRFFLQGNALSQDLKYLVQLAFGALDPEAGNASVVLDAFVEYTRLRDLNLRVGQYFVPFDRARTIRESSLQFIDRQVVVRELTLDRDVGLSVGSQDLFGLGGRLAYALFIGGGDGRNRVGAQMVGPLTTARIAVKPFGSFDDDVEGDVARDTRPRLALGVAAGYNVHATRNQSTFGTTLTLGTFDYGHFAADLVFKWRGFSLLAEGVYRKSLNGDVLTSGMTREYSRSGWGYFVQGGLMVSRLVEITARWDQLFALQGTDPALTTLVSTQGRQVGGGVNVYLDGHIVKLQADYFYLWGYRANPGRHAVRIALDASF